MQKAVAVLDAISADDEIGCLSDSDPFAAKVPIISGSLDCKRRGEHSNDGEFSEILFDPPGMMIVPRPPQDFKEDDVADKQEATGNERAELCRNLDVVLSK